MTFLACQITKTGALISMDRLVYAASEDDRAAAVGQVRVKFDPAEAAASCFSGGGDPDAVTRSGYAFKPMIFPRFGLICGQQGPFGFAGAWATRLAEILTPISGRDLCALAPQLLRQLRSAIYPDDALQIVLAGFDPVAGEGFGLYATSADDFAGLDLAPAGFITSPSDPDDAAFAEVELLRQEAAAGRYIERFHRALYGQQRRAFRAGRLAPGVACGGGLDHVEISAGGIAITSAPDPAGDAG